MASDSGSIFHMCIPCGKTYYLVQMSRSSVAVKVRYQGDISVSQTQLVLLFPQCCKKPSFLRDVKTWDCGKGLNVIILELCQHFMRLKPLPNNPDF